MESPIKFDTVKAGWSIDIPRTQLKRTGHLHTGKCIDWKYTVMAQWWLSF